MKKIILIIALIIATIALMVTYEPNIANHGSEIIVPVNQGDEVVIPTSIEGRLVCKEDLDCILETELNPGCSHVCVGDECTENLRVCNVYYKDGEEAKEKQNLVCFWNEPCKEPGLIECVAGKCVAE